MATGKLVEFITSEKCSEHSSSSKGRRVGGCSINQLAPKSDACLANSICVEASGPDTVTANGSLPSKSSMDHLRIFNCSS